MADMPTLPALLADVVARGGSDPHLIQGLPPIVGNRAHRRSASIIMTEATGCGIGIPDSLRQDPDGLCNAELPR